ncbi:MAG: phytanoyl-CoA dioxygenase family protein [Acidimicrobiales bacterium]|nr:phytanoyl-CoA dioxygenase family protein [Acidimicrobiales bacterium]
MTDVSGILPPDARTTYEADGFVQAGRLLTDAEADALAAVIADMADDEAHPDHDRLYDMGVDGQPLLHLKNMWAQHPAFSEVIHRPEIAQILYALTGRRRHRLWQDGFFYKPPRTGSAHAWHQDLRRIPVAPGAIGTGVWLALSDVSDPSTGPMRLLAGSQHRTIPTAWLDHPPLPEPDRAPAEPFLEGTHAVTATMAKGSVHVHDGWVLHGSTRNTSELARCGLLLFFVDGDVELDPTHPDAGQAPEARCGVWDPSLHPMVEADDDHPDAAT